MSAARLDVTFAALADPTRRAILARLAKGDASVTELAKPFELSQPAISKHLKVLERAGLVSRGRDAQRRPCRLEGAPLKAAASWIAKYREAWEERFAALEDVVAELKQAEAHEQPKGTRKHRENP
jgi:DNA-binding transcriptional ArsR family regulator